MRPSCSALPSLWNKFMAAFGCEIGHPPVPISDVFFGLISGKAIGEGGYCSVGDEVKGQVVKADLSNHFESLSKFLVREVELGKVVDLVL